MNEMAMRERIDELEEQVRQLKERAHGSVDLKYMVAFGISREESRMLQLLMREVGVSIATWASAHQDLEQPMKLINKRVHDIRRKLKKHDIKIETIWGEGYRMPPAYREKVRAIVEAVE